MAQVTASIGTVPYKIEITSPSGNVLISDEPIESGGQNKGFSPKELLASALAACTSATLSMYAKRKEWPLEKAEVEVELKEEENHTTFLRKIKLTGDLDQEQRDRMLQIANACPVHKILISPTVVETVME